MSPFNQPKGMVAYGDIGVMLNMNYLCKQKFQVLLAFHVQKCALMLCYFTMHSVACAD